MGSIEVTDRNGEIQQLDAKVGQKVMEIIRNASLDIEAQCGGCCSCATCHVYIEPDHWSRTGERTPDEEDMLDLVDGVKETSRLSCQILYSEAMDGLKVIIAPE